MRSGLDGAHLPAPSRSALPPPPSQPFQASPLPAPHQPSPVPTPARHPRGLRTRGGGREADPEQGGSNWEALGVCREKLRVLGSLCGHACSGDRGNPIGVPAGAEGGFARVCVCVCVCVCTCECECEWMLLESLSLFVREGFPKR